MTHRQFEAWQAWLAEEWNKPDRGDYYTMRLIHTVAHLTRKDDGNTSLDSYKIPFASRKPDGKAAHNEQGLTKEQVTALSKARWKLMIAQGLEAQEKANGQRGRTRTTHRPPAR